jgi:hypothetical protein
MTTKAQSAAAMLERKVFRASHHSEFATVPALIKQTGQPVASWLLSHPRRSRDRDYR